MDILIAIALAGGVGGFIWYAVRNAGSGGGRVSHGGGDGGDIAFTATDMTVSGSSPSDSGSCDAGDSGGGDCGGGGD